MNTACKACRCTSAIHKETIEKELERLKASSVPLADDALYGRRLEICSSCKYLDISSACMMCGCYVKVKGLEPDTVLKREISRMLC